MINLIKRDLYIFRKHIAWVLMFPILHFYILIAASFNDEFIYISFIGNILLLSSVTHNSILKLDEQNKTKILMACLPIDRLKDIKSKTILFYPSKLRKKKKLKKEPEIIFNVYNK